MARYWVYLNDEVAGPFAVEQLIRQRGFSRQTLVCVDDASGKPTNWISPAEIPELAHIFKAVDEQHAAPTPAPIRMAPPKPAPARSPRPYTPAVTLKAPSRDSSSAWIWAVLAAMLLGGGIFGWLRYAHKDDQLHDQEAAQALIENARLPAASLYSSLKQYMQEKEIKPKWEFEKIQDALYHVSLSWYAPALNLYAFEANTQSQTIRGLNTAAVKLLSEGFPPPPSAPPKAPETPKKPSSELFSQAMDARQSAIESGDFQTVWDLFSARKKTEMAKAGISQEGFLRLQNLTHKVDSTVKQTVLKTKSESDTEMLALIKESHPERPDIFVKQLWIFQDGAWKLDDEQKKSASTPSMEPSAPPAASSTTSAPAPKAAPASLPGMSN